MERLTAAQVVHRRQSAAIALRELQDKAEIAEVCVRYAYALDRKDWASVAACFVEPATFSHPGGTVEGAEAIVARAEAALGHLDASQHLIGSITVEVVGDTATSLCYFHGQHVREGTPGGDLYTIAGSYADRLVRTPEGWRIAERVQTYHWRSGNRQVVAR